MDANLILYVTCVTGWQETYHVEKNDRYIGCSGPNSMHTELSIFLFKLFSLVTPEYYYPFLLSNYAHVIALEPDLRRLTFTEDQISSNIAPPTSFYHSQYSLKSHIRALEPHYHADNSSSALWLL